MRGGSAMSPRPWSSLFAACAIALFATGCTPFWTDAQETGLTPPAAARPDPVETRLAEAAERADAALTMLARIRAAETSLPAAELPLEVPSALQRPVTIDWIGPLETLAEHLAAYAGYSFRMAGPPPVRPAMVVIAAQAAPVIEILRDAGLQAGDAATLTVDAAQRTVRLDWTGERPGTGERPRTAPGSGGS